MKYEAERIPEKSDVESANLDAKTIDADIENQQHRLILRHVKFRTKNSSWWIVKGSDWPVSRIEVLRPKNDHARLTVVDLQR